MDLFKQLQNFFRPPKPVIGLALGGGGARGLAHLGVLKTLQKNDIAIDLIAGTSMGALVGGAYAQNPDIKVLLPKAIKYLKSRENIEKSTVLRVMNSSGGRISRWASSLMKYYFLARNARDHSLLKQENLEKVTRTLLRDELIKEAKIPFAAVAVDIISGKVKTFHQGPIRQAVNASIAIPGIFPPVEVDKRLLVDGGVSSLVPVEEARSLGADKVIAVDVSKPLENEEPPQRGIDLLYRVDDITRAHLKDYQLQKADLVIRPKVNDIHWFEFDRYQEIIPVGENATQDLMPKIRKIVR